MRTADWARIGLWVGSPEAQSQAVCSTCPGYVREILAHAGIFFTELPREQLGSGAFTNTILLFVANVALSEQEQAQVRAHLEAGGAAIFLTHHSGATELLGVEPDSPGQFAWGSGFVPLGEGYLVPDADDTDPLTGDMLPGLLHYFGGTAVRANTAQVLAGGNDSLGEFDSRPLITEHRVGKGLALFIAPDLPGTVALIQQGTYVETDRPSAPDGSINTTDGILKADDGVVLDYALDRDAHDGESMRCYTTPVADRWREILIRAILYAAQTCGLPLPVLWYYPRNLPALAMLSFDSDGNNRVLAETLLANCRRLGIRATWSILEPGYNDEFMRKLIEAGMEVGLHYNALNPSDEQPWSRAAFERQLNLLRSRIGGLPCHSNKNHYTRWEGRLEFFRWCAELGVLYDESRGPSKTGEVGFLFGSCHPWFPMESNGERIPVMEISFLTQDLVVTLPASFARHLAAWVAKVYGVAHLLFHPVHCTKPGVYEAMADFLHHARSLGMELWTDAEIYAWETARRGVSLTSQTNGFSLSTQTPLKDATVLTLTAGNGAVERYGFAFDVRQLDLDHEQPKVIEFNKL